MQGKNRSNDDTLLLGITRPFQPVGIPKTGMFPMCTWGRDVERVCVEVVGKVTVVTRAGFAVEEDEFVVALVFALSFVVVVAVVVDDELLSLLFKVVFAVWESRLPLIIPLLPRPPPPPLLPITPMGTSIETTFGELI